MDQVWEIVRSIPPGRVASYGDVGAALKNPMSGFLVGRIMARAPAGVPWWRVVAKTGNLPIGKRHPKLMSEQESLLREEGVVFLDQGRVDMRLALWQL